MNSDESFSVDDILPDHTESEELVPEIEENPVALRGTTEIIVDPEEAKQEVENLKSTLTSWTKNGKNLFLDLRAVDFKSTDDDMYLVFKDRAFYEKKLFFKFDPDDAKNPKILHAQKQFCKFLGVPHTFFKTNRPSLRENIVRTWQAGLNAEDKPKKYQCVARIREADDHAIIRAMVPVDATMMDNSEILDIISKEVGTPYKLHLSTGITKDDLIFHARFLLPAVFKIGHDDVCLGFAITASELGASSLDVDILVHNIESDTSIITTYGGDPFFSCKYTGIRNEEIKELFPTLIERVHNETIDIRERLESKLHEIHPEVECASIKSIKGFNTKFKKALYHEVAEAASDMTTPWDFARHMGLIAKDFDTNMRTKIERSIGTYLNLVFPA
jgi:hypothetical protein